MVTGEAGFRGSETLHIGKYVLGLLAFVQKRIEKKEIERENEKERLHRAE